MPDILTVTSPYDRHFIREFPLADEKEIEKTLAVAHGLFRDPSKWLPKYQRIAILEKLATVMESQVEELTMMAAEEGGKPYKDSKVEVLRAINGVKLAVAEMYHLRGEEIPMGMTAASVNRLAFTTREPIGVVLSISAFNHPLNLVVHQVIPALAAGCPVIVKPASTTPVSCFNLVRLLKGCGLPDGWCTALVCRRELAEKLAADPRIGYMTFIGSHEVGWKLKNLLAPGTRFALEHGGVAPVIVDGTAGIDEIVPLIAKGGFYHAGQVCVSVQKVFVHRSKARELAGKLAEEADKLIVGDPLDPATDIGPMIAESEAQRVQEWVEEAISSGAELVQSSKFKVQSSKCKSKIKSSNRPIVQSSNRQIVQSPNRQIVQSPNRPIVLFAPPDSAKVSREEVFGPVICVYPFDDLGDAVARANSLRYAFQAAVFTQNINTALEAAQRLNASAVMINDHTAFRVDWMPFGGRDESGIGTGGIPYTMREMTREKLIVFKS
ncbi:MAG TPA: aldehyde dehydrogenase family protein [Bacteroidales bacterium]|nr:aldehyde dehydrogenase family protein [Bacteroidales bacterium]